MRATAYFKVPTSMVPVAADTCFTFDGRDAQSIGQAWERARRLRTLTGAKEIVRWGAVQVEGPWSRAPRIDT